MPTNGIYVGLKHISKYNGVNGEGILFEKTYFISQYLKTNALSARAACKNYGNSMDLAAFESREEFLKIRTKLNTEVDTDPVVIGGFVHKTGSNFQYFWISTGTKIDYPFDATRDQLKCLGIQNEGAVAYVPVSCDEGKYKFICQDVDYQYAN